MDFKNILILYILFVGCVSLLSYKKGIYLIWISFLFIPTIILETQIVLRAQTIMMIGSLISELRYEARRTVWSRFIIYNQRVILLFILFSMMISLFSETVPMTTQLECIMDEIAILLFSAQTFLFAKDEHSIAHTLMMLVCGAIIFNMVYCIIFEIVIGINPAGMPLYILMGIDDNRFVVDMIDYERGELSFRAQTIYRHPLSLGQYLLVLLPVFLSKKKVRLRLMYVVIISILITLTGSRSSLFPLLLILAIAFMKVVDNVISKLFFLSLGLVVCISFIPEKEWKRVSEKIEPFVASLQFWDDQKQKDNDIKGSSMEMRLDQFDAALDEISGNPLFGRGYGYRDYYIGKHNALHPRLLGFESILLLYLVERGWLGLLFFFILIFYMYRHFKSTTSEEFVISFIFLGFILSIVMTGIRPLSLLFVCLAGSIACGMSPKQDCLSNNGKEVKS